MLHPHPFQQLPCLPPRSGGAGCHRVLQLVESINSMLISRCGVPHVNQATPSPTSAHTLVGGCLCSRARALAREERQRDASSHGSPTSDGSLMPENQWFCPNSGWMTDRPPRNPTEHQKREPPTTTTAAASTSSLFDPNSLRY